EIRVAILHPATNLADSMHCSLTTFNLSNNPSYDVLSYAWGSDSNPAVITLSGFGYRITQNLDSALRYLLHTTEDRSLWIDALAINQFDHVEKSVQVKMM
ncbi:heterokaryon incompatibility protein-domain-containing protein, partial [Pyrenochaeta sp. MPI-SDFR-AT-0127]